ILAHHSPPATPPVAGGTDGICPAGSSFMTFDYHCRQSHYSFQLRVWIIICRLFSFFRDETALSNRLVNASINSAASSGVTTTFPSLVVSIRTVLSELVA